ncbi:MAG: hypothetical protein AAB785_00965 [Patescibacteria group bacterium]
MEIFNNFDPKKLVEPAYLFEKTPPADSDYRYLVFIFGFLVIIAIANWFWYRRKFIKIPVYREIRNKLFNIFFYPSIVGLFLIFCRWQAIPYLGSRFFLGLLLIVFVIWLIYLLYFRLIIFPKEIKEFLKQENFNKYLPKNNQKNRKVKSK